MEETILAEANFYLKKKKKQQQHKLQLCIHRLFQSLQSDTEVITYNNIWSVTCAQFNLNGTMFRKANCECKSGSLAGVNK